MKTRKQIAGELNISVEQFRNWERKAAAESNGALGTDHGANKPKTYSQDEIDLILAYAPEGALDQQDLANQVDSAPGFLVPHHKIDILPPNGYGKSFEMGKPYALHLHIHTTNKAQYQATEQATDQNVQALLNQALKARFEQGQEDQAEIDAVIGAAKSKLIEAGIAGLAMGKGDGSSQESGSASQERSPS